eukprot:1143328-Pelagomonas_calceolata.AAC.14
MLPVVVLVLGCGIAAVVRVEAVAGSGSGSGLGMVSRSTGWAALVGLLAAVVLARGAVSAHVVHILEEGRAVEPAVVAVAAFGVVDHGCAAWGGATVLAGYACSSALACNNRQGRMLPW